MPSSSWISLSTAEERSLAPVSFSFAKCLSLHLELADFALNFVDHARNTVRLDTQSARGFIHQVDRLVGQKPVGDISLTEFHGRDNRSVRNADTVMDFILFFEAAQDRDGVRRTLGSPTNTV